MDRETGTAEPRLVVDESANGEPAVEDLTQVADEMLQQVSLLRHQYEELRDALAETAAKEAPEPAGGQAAAAPDRDEGGRTNIRAIALQVAFAGDSRDAAKEYLRTFEVEGSDQIVDDVFDRTEAQRTAQRRRIFGRRAH
jgi:hypothetical protein